MYGRAKEDTKTFPPEIKIGPNFDAVAIDIDEWMDFVRKERKE